MEIKSSGLVFKAVSIFKFLNEGLAIPHPEEEGFYFWHILDWSYFDCGVVHVHDMGEKHRKYLASSAAAVSMTSKA